MFLIFLTAAALCILLFTLRIVRGGSKPLLTEQGWSGFYQIDIAAFRNLLSEEEEEFLKTSLTRAHYRQVRRARVRGVQEYLFWITDNCAAIIAVLRSASDSGTQPESNAEVERLVRNAVRLRITGLCFWTLLWLEYLLPSIDIHPLSALSQYEEFWRFADAHLRTHLAPPVPVSSKMVG